MAVQLYHSALTVSVTYPVRYMSLSMQWKFKKMTILVSLRHILLLAGTGNRLTVLIITELNTLIVGYVQALMNTITEMAAKDDLDLSVTVCRTWISRHILLKLGCCVIHFTPLLSNWSTTSSHSSQQLHSTTSDIDSQTSRPHLKQSNIQQVFCAPC